MFTSTFVLFIFTIANTITLATAEFDSKEACWEAARFMVAESHRRDDIGKIKATCVSKKTGKQEL